MRGTISFTHYKSVGASSQRAHMDTPDCGEMVVIAHRLLRPPPRSQSRLLRYRQASCNRRDYATEDGT